MRDVPGIAGSLCALLARDVGVDQVAVVTPEFGRSLDGVDNERLVDVTRVPQSGQCLLRWLSVVCRSAGLWFSHELVCSHG